MQQYLKKNTLHKYFEKTAAKKDTRGTKWERRLLHVPRRTPKNAAEKGHIERRSLLSTGPVEYFESSPVRAGIESRMGFQIGVAIIS